MAGRVHFCCWINHGLYRIYMIVASPCESSIKHVLHVSGCSGATLQQLPEKLGIFPREESAAALRYIVGTPTREGSTCRRLKTSSRREDKTWTTPKVPLLSRYVDSTAIHRTAVLSVPAAERGKSHEMLARTSCSGGETTTWRAS